MNPEPTGAGTRPFCLRRTIAVSTRSSGPLFRENISLLGLLACSSWIMGAIDDRQDIFLYSRTNSGAMDAARQAFWSGQSIEELYRALSASLTIYVRSFRCLPCSRESLRSKPTAPFDRPVRWRIREGDNVLHRLKSERLETAAAGAATWVRTGLSVGLFRTVRGHHF